MPEISRFFGIVITMCGARSEQTLERVDGLG